MPIAKMINEQKVQECDATKATLTGRRWDQNLKQQF